MLFRKIFESGIVGAGGAGFPTYIKAKSKAKILIVNGAECEPLIHKDFEIMKNFPSQIIEGTRLMMESINAEKAIIGIKEKNQEAVDAIQSEIKKYKNISIHLLGDFYPAGDEYVLVYEAAGKLIPSGGIPLDLGIVVNNVETIYNISLAQENKPLTHKFVTINGSVKKPQTFYVPIGTPFSDLIDLAGGSSTKDYAIFNSGVMMGTLEIDEVNYVKKTTSAVIVLPIDHKLVRRRNINEKDYYRIGKSACDQCSYCTELCPRYILGHNIQPHKVMRSLGFTKSGTDLWNEFGLLCCSCGLCTLYSCPEDLYPKESCDLAKESLKKKNIFVQKNSDVRIHPMYKYRRTPVKRLVQKLDLMKYENHTPLSMINHIPNEVFISFKQGLGTPSTSCITINQNVNKGDIISKSEENKLGCNNHSTISGIVKDISNEGILITSK